jgi:hypothetical protein
MKVGGAVVDRDLEEFVQIHGAGPFETGHRPLPTGAGL